MITIIDPNLTSKVLTEKMPLSDAFNRAQAAGGRMGVHHGLALSFDDALWPLKKYSTQNLKISAGKAVIGAENSNYFSATEKVLMTTILEEDSVIDLDAQGIGSADANVYWIYIAITYQQPTVKEYTGLVQSIGQNAAKILIDVATTGTGFYSRKGLLLGKFCRATKYVETIGDQVFNNSDINLSNVNGNIPNSMKESTRLALSVLASIANNTSNLRKHLRIENIKDPSVAETLKTTTMPLHDVTASVATSVANLEAWAKPIDWYNESFTSIYATKKVYRDVEKFELFNCHFESDMQFAFHRTPGHNIVAEWIAEGTPEKMYDGTLRNYPDHGSDQFIFDAKGSVFEGNLILDLVLDFSGSVQDRVFKVKIKNLRVMGDLIINYGQSFFGMFVGSQAVIEYDNVQVYGDNNKLRPWPALQNLVFNSAVNNPNYIGLGFNIVMFFLNTAAYTLFTGYNQTPGPTFLNKLCYNVNGPSPAATFSTAGVLFTQWLYNVTDGLGDMAMGDPWRLIGTDAGIVIKNSTVPSKMLDELIRTYGEHVYYYIMVKLQNCKYQVMGSIEPNYGYRLQSATFKQAGDGVYNLLEYQSGSWKDIIFIRDLFSVRLFASGNISGLGLSSASEDIGSARDLIAARNLLIGGKVGMSSIGGVMVKMTNKTGAVSVAGKVVRASATTNDAFRLNAVNEAQSIGIMYEDGVADGAETWIIIGGIADVAMKDNTAATRGNWVKASSEAGYADATNAAPPGGGIPELDSHMNEIGHCIENVGAGGGGTHIKARCIIHIN